MQQNITQTVEEDEIDLLALGITLWEKKKLIIAITALGIILSVLIALILPRQYVSKANFLPISKSSKGLPGGLGGLASMVGISVPGGSGGDLDYQVLLNSQSLTERVIEKQKLLPLLLEDLFDPETGELMEAKPGLMKSILSTFRSPDSDKNELTEEQKRQFLLNRAVDIMLKKVLSVQEDKKNGLISISVSWEDSFKAAEIANAYLRELEDYIQQHELTTTKKSLVFIQSRLEETEKELSLAEENLMDFSKEHGIFDVSDQSSTVASVIGKVKGEIALREVELQVVQQYQGRDSVKTRMIQSTLTALREQLQKLEKGIDSKKKEDSFEIALAELPNLGLEFARLKREVMIQQEIYKLLRTQLETTRIEEAKESDAVQIIDIAIPSEGPAKPKRKLIVAVGTVTSFILAVFFVFFLEFVKGLREEYQARLKEE